VKIHIVSLIVLGWAGSLLGQEPASRLPPLPEGSLLKRAPDFSSWTVLFSKIGGKVEARESKSDQDKTRPQRQVAVTKTGKVIHEIKVDALGKSTEVWHVGGVQVTVPSGNGFPSIFPDFGGGDIYTTNYAVSDFAGLDWISATTFAGIQKVMGRDCIIFRSEVNTLQKDEQVEEELVASRALVRQLDAARKKGGTPNAPAPPAGVTKAPAVACIDLETRLPVAVTFGNETRTYQYGQPPGEMQVLPAALAVALNEYQARIQGLSRLPAKP
jgi:hypothetical protein